MKIVIVATSGESLVNFRGKLIEEWCHLGHKVTCISIEPKEQIEKELKTLSDVDYFQVVGDRTSAGLFGGFRMISAYTEAFKIIRPDLVFLYMSKPIAFGGIAAIHCKIERIFIFQTGLEIPFYSKGIKNAVIRIVLKKLYKYVQKHSEVVFFMCHEDLKKMIKWKIVDEAKTEYVDGSGVDMTHFVKTDLPQSPIVCMISRLVWSKGVREYIEAAQIIKKEYPELGIRFLLVGGLDTNSESLSKEELDLLVSHGVVEYCGYHKDVFPFIKECSIFVLPSYHEGKGKVILEAQAVGRPIITTTAPGCSETVEDGYNGFKVPPRDAKQLAEKIVYLARNPELRKQLADNAYEFCRTTFDVNVINKKILTRMKLIN